MTQTWEPHVLSAFNRALLEGRQKTARRDMDIVESTMAMMSNTKIEIAHKP